MTTPETMTTSGTAEGPNGVGKSYLLSALVDRLGDRCRLLTELTDVEGEHVPAEVISALPGGRSFLRTGHPRTETFALMALKVREHEPDRFPDRAPSPPHRTGRPRRDGHLVLAEGGDRR